MSRADDMDQLLTTIQEALDATGVYVAPSMSTHVDTDEVAQIEAAIARSPEPLFAVVYPFAYDDAFGGSPGDLLSRLHDASGVGGLYVANNPIYAGGSPRLDARAWDDLSGGASSDTYALAAIGSAAAPDDLGAQLVTVSEAVADGTVQEQYDALRDQSPDTSTGTSGSGEADGSATPYLVTGGIVLAVVVLVAMVRRRPRTTTPTRRDFTLPASVLDRVRDADEEQLTRRAHREVLALGERIDATEMDADAAPGSWQAALDHYDAARRVLGDSETGTDLLDIVGAVVLAQRGAEALTAATKGRDFTPTTPCFLDPLHGAGTVDGTIELDGVRTTVPLCSACRTALRKKRRPDILDVVQDGKPVHYFETDAEPWASTGYGALSPDLVERLHGRR